MFRVLLVLLFGITTLPLHASTAPQTERMTIRQVQALTRSAHTAADFEHLATYFAKEARRFEELSVATDLELKRELQHPSAGSKYPNAADRTRRWKEYYDLQADHMRANAETYRKKAALTEHDVTQAAAH